MKPNTKCDLLSKYIISSDGCWIYTGSTNQAGYGQFRVNGYLYRTHRLSWEIHNGPIPAQMKVLHHCDNPKCMNPTHLFLGSQQDNVNDCKFKGRFKSNAGSCNPKAFLNECEVIQIKELLRAGKFSQGEIAHKFKISRSTINNIATGKTWCHVK